MNDTDHEECAKLSDCFKTEEHSIFCPLNPKFSQDIMELFGVEEDDSPIRCGTGK